MNCDEKMLIAIGCALLVGVLITLFSVNSDRDYKKYIEWLRKERSDLIDELEALRRAGGKS